MSVPLLLYSSNTLITSIKSRIGHFRLKIGPGASLTCAQERESNITKSLDSFNSQAEISQLETEMVHSNSERNACFLQK
jgi:hypothetical protein